MAEEIRDVTVRLKVDTKDVELQESKVKKAFDQTNTAINEQLNLTGKQRATLERLIELRNTAFRIGAKQNKFAIKALDEEISALKEAGKQTEKLGDETVTLNKKSSNLVGTFKKIGVALGVAFAARTLINFVKQLNQTAIEMEAFRRRAEKVFGDSVDIIKEFAKENAIALGFTETEFLGAAAAIGDLLIPLVANREEAAKMSTQLLKTAAALKIFQGSEKSVQEISDILTNSLAGRVVGLRQLQINIDRTSKEFKDLVKVKMEDEGATKSQAKSLAIYDMILEQSNDAIVDFEENTDSLAKSQAELGANIRTLTEELALLLTPAFALATEAILKQIEFVNDSSSNLEKLTKILQFFSPVTTAATLANNLFNKSQEDTIDIIGASILLREDGSKLTKEEIRNVFFLQERIKELTEEQGKQATSVLRVKQITQELIPLREELAELTGKETKATRELKKAQDDLSRANEKFRKQVFKAIEDANKLIEELQVETIDNELKRDLAKIELQREIEKKAIEDSLASEEQKLIIIAGLEDKFNKESLDRQIKAAEDANEIRDKEKQEAIADAQERQEAINGFIQQGFDIFADLQQRQTTLRLEALRQQGLSDEEFETRKRQILLESAQQQKTLALFNITVATAKAVTEALAVPPAPNIILATLAAALGAAQLAIVATTPVPQFAEGTLDAPGGLSIVGERGRELSYVPSGAKILPNDKTEKYAGVIDSMFKNKFDQYIMERYIPDMVMSSTETPTYNDHRLRGDVRNSRFNRGDAEAIGRAVAKHTSRQQKYLKWYA